MTPEYLNSIQNRLSSGVIKPQDVTNLIEEVRSLTAKLEERIVDVDAIAKPIKDGIDEAIERSEKPKKAKATNHQVVESPAIAS